MPVLHIEFHFRQPVAVIFPPYLAQRPEACHAINILLREMRTRGRLELTYNSILPASNSIPTTHETNSTAEDIARSIAFCVLEMMDDEEPISPDFDVVGDSSWDTLQKLNGDLPWQPGQIWHCLDLNGSPAPHDLIVQGTTLPVPELLSGVILAEVHECIPNASTGFIRVVKSDYDENPFDNDNCDYDDYDDSDYDDSDYDDYDDYGAGDS